MKPKNKRLLTVFSSLSLFILGCAIIFINLKENIVFFYSPSEILKQNPDSSEMFRLGGMVKVGSVKKKQTQLNNKNVEEIFFTVTDTKKEISISYIGILPDLFKEGQGVVVEGKLVNSSLFKASEVLAKHDENYMPPQIQKKTLTVD